METEERTTNDEPTNRLTTAPTLSSQTVCPDGCIIWPFTSMKNCTIALKVTKAGSKLGQIKLQKIAKDLKISTNLITRFDLSVGRLDSFRSSCSLKLNPVSLNT